MSQILAVFGATGQQGSSVITHVLNTPELSSRYKIRAITRDIDSSKARDLRSRAVEVITGDVTDRSSLETALTDVHTVFVMTPQSFGPDALETEFNQVKTIADVALDKGVTYIIYSTLPSVREVSSGKYTSLTAFDAKAKAEAHIRDLPIKSAFYSPGSFMENFLGPSALVPHQADDGTYVLARHVSPHSQFPLINATSDTGKFIGAVLASPSEFEGKRICAATSLYSMDEIASTLSDVTGKKVVYKQVSLEESIENIKACFPAFLAGIVEIVTELFSYQQKFGYFGPGTQESVALAVNTVQDKLTTLEEFLKVHEFHLH